VSTIPIVVYPALESTSGNVIKCLGSGSQPICVYENVPVRMSARAGMVGKEESTWLSNTTDERANSSRWGVRMRPFP
jgi:hypothetical protein